MTGKQHAVMWLGLSLILVRLFTTNQWSTIWGTLSTGGGGSSPNSGGGGLTIPNPLPGQPGIKISKNTTNPKKS